MRDAVAEMLGTTSHLQGSGSSRFVGCRTTGLNASELHELPPEKVRAKMMEATVNLLRDGKVEDKEMNSATATSTSGDVGNDNGSSSTTSKSKSKSSVKAICLGCAGMVGLEEAVREACIEELGAEEGKRVAIVDGVKAGVGTLITLARGGF